MAVSVIPKPRVLAATYFNEVTVDRSMNSTTPEDFLEIVLTPKSASNFFLIYFSFSGEGGATTQLVFRILSGLTGSESQVRACYAYAYGNELHRGGTTGCVLRVAAAGAGEHTIKVTWHNAGSENVIRLRPVVRAGFDHSSLIVQEVSG